MTRGSAQTTKVHYKGQNDDFLVFIDDVATAFVAAINAGPDATRPTLDVGTGVASTIADMAEAIAAYYKAPAPVVNGKYRDGDVRSASCSIDLTLATLDWSPQWSLDAGVAALQRWIAGELSATEASRG